MNYRRQYKTANAHDGLDNQGYRHTPEHVILSCTATMITRMQLNVTLYVHCLTCYLAFSLL